MPRSYINKSGRKRGVIYMVIRAMAKRRKKFKVEDLVPPLTWEQASWNLRHLTDMGELIRIRKELIQRNGVWDIQGVYTATKLLRPAELTNRQL